MSRRLSTQVPSRILFDAELVIPRPNHQPAADPRDVLAARDSTCRLLGLPGIEE
jgi:hypothetical protein